MADGIGCKCGAYGECECGCGVDWTPQELIDARERIASLEAKLDCATYMLASWCEAIEHNGTGWDDWDEYYKDAAFRPCMIRDEIDMMLNLIRSERGE